jgi:lysophospholipase L1-like esterase
LLDRSGSGRCGTLPGFHVWQTGQNPPERRRGDFYHGLLSSVLLLALGCVQSAGTSVSGTGAASGGRGGSDPAASGGTPGTGGTTGVRTGAASGGATGQGGSLAAGGATSRPGTGGTGSGGRMGGSGGKGEAGLTGTRDGAAADTGPGDARNDRMARDTVGESATGGVMGDGGGTGGLAADGSDGGGTGKITLWLAGDSTVANGSTPCPVGWGKPFPSLFDSRVAVTNSAHGGRSVQTWLYDVGTTKGADGECELNSTTYLADWTNMLKGMKTGDYLFIQFGINDGDSSCNRHVGTALFQTYYGMMAQAARERGANPIFITPVSSISCSGSKAVGSRGTYAAATKQAGATYDVPVIDLEQRSVALYSSLGFCPLPGPDNSATFASGEIGAFFCEDHTHFEAAGAAQIAGLIAQALRDQDIELASYLK